MLSYLIALAVVGLLVRFGWSAVTRQKALRAMAEERGWAYTRRDPGLAERYHHLAIFRRGRPWAAMHVLRGDLDGVPVEVFDHAYKLRNRTQTMTVVHLHDPSLGLPAFHLWPKDVLMRRSGGSGFQEVDLPHRPDLAERYILGGPDHAAVRGLFADVVVDAVEAAPAGLCVEGRGADLVLYRDGVRARPADIPGLAAYGSQLLRLLEATAIAPPPLRGATPSVLEQIQSLVRGD
jgi:hypothetical protein